MNHRALLHAEIRRLNPPRRRRLSMCINHRIARPTPNAWRLDRQRRRFPLRIVLGCAALAGLLWFLAFGVISK
jgi:hypothetical protein